jgi:hypothetical protein
VKRRGRNSNWAVSHLIFLKFVGCNANRKGKWFLALVKIYLLIIRIIKSRRMRWAGHVARMGEKRNAYRLLVGKPEGKRPRKTKM